MTLKKDGTLIFGGEACYVPVCSICGGRHILYPVPEGLHKASFCPDCGHKLFWGDSKGGLT